VNLLILNLDFRQEGDDEKKKMQFRRWKWGRVGKRARPVLATSWRRRNASEGTTSSGSHERGSLGGQVVLLFFMKGASLKELIKGGEWVKTDMGESTEDGRT